MHSLILIFWMAASASRSDDGWTPTYVYHTTDFVLVMIGSNWHQENSKPFYFRWNIYIEAFRSKVHAGSSDCLYMKCLAPSCHGKCAHLVILVHVLLGLASVLRLLSSVRISHLFPLRRKQIVLLDCLWSHDHFPPSIVTVFYLLVYIELLSV